MNNKNNEIIYQVENLKKYFPVYINRDKFGFFHEKKYLKAVDGISFNLPKGKTLAIVGESGCGKSTLARVLLRLIEPSSGTILFEGEDIVSMNKENLRKYRQHIQMIFQDPYSSLHPRMTVEAIISEVWFVHKNLAPKNKRERVIELLGQVGLLAEYVDAFPARLSGGERQRISIARALAMNPKILILDEPVSALDVSIQAQIITLLMNLQRNLGISYIFISHDLPLVRLVADDVAVMYMGQFVEKAPVNELFSNPLHPYTKLLLSSTPELINMDDDFLEDTIDKISPIFLPQGCRFQSRCYKANALCKTDEFLANFEGQFKDDHYCACIRYESNK